MALIPHLTASLQSYQIVAPRSALHSSSREACRASCVLELVLVPLPSCKLQKYVTAPPISVPTSDGSAGVKGPERRLGCKNPTQSPSSRAYIFASIS